LLSEIDVFFLFQAQKELLDRELDLITHEQTGGDTKELRYRVEELKKEVSLVQCWLPIMLLIQV
jgi:hypothetical protein